MRTQITCPNCGTPYTADIHQIIDASRQPNLKEALIAGQLNVAVCNNCGAGGRISTPLLYHDPAHQLFIVHVPQELNLDQVRREEMVGRLVKQIMDATPPEQRRGYMLQPQMMLTMQGFMEKVLSTEGITPEMIARQQKQFELLRTMSTASPDVVDYLIKERGREIDETFLTMLRQQIDAVSQGSNDPNAVIPLLNLQAKLMAETPAGRELEKRQMAIHALNREAKKEQGISPALLLKHILLNRDDEALVNAMAMSAQPAMNYEFFALLTGEVENAQKANNAAAAKQLADMRDRLLQMQEEIRKASQEMLGQANQLLDEILAAPDMENALVNNSPRIDDAFIHVLQGRMTRAEQAGNQAELQKLEQIHSMLMSEAQEEIPDELQFLNELLMSESAEAADQLIRQNASMITPDLLGVLEAVEKQSRNEGRPDLADRLKLLANRMRQISAAA